jgi:hypothetical protein
MEEPEHMGTTTIEAPVAPEVAEPLEPALRDELLTHLDERGQVTVRCRFDSELVTMIRIWRTTFLVCAHTGHRSELMHAEGITYAPQWMPVLPGAPAEFVLVFAPLPKSCSVFDLVEVIPQPGGFHVPGIVRNSRDLYFVEI